MSQNKSLEELENDIWDEPSFKSHLTLECYRLRKLPLSQLTAENIRMLVGQKIGLQFLIPLALDMLHKNPFVEGHMYRGDLLDAILKVPETFWTQNAELNNRLVEIAQEIIELSESLNNEWLPLLSRFEYKHKKSNLV